MDQPTPPSHREWARNISGLAVGSSAGVWKVAVDAYYWDRLAEAFAFATELGVTAPFHEWMFRLIESEAVTREKGTIAEIGDRISLEIVPNEIDDPERATSDVLQACAEVRQRFNWPEGADTLVSVLAEETDAPWTVGRAGYMMDKYPYDKICIPRGATVHPPMLQAVIRHEYAHVMVLNLSQGKATTYLHEAITMVAERTDRSRDWHLFAAGQAPWQNPTDLDSAFDDRHDPARFAARALAYSQSAAIGYFLRSRGGEATLGRLLRAFAENSNWSELKRTLAGRSPADEMLRQVYGVSEKDVFSQTLQVLTQQAGRGPRGAS